MINQEKNNQKKKRKVELLVLSDIHLGTYGCRAKELVNYMKSIKPKTVVLNGDIIDMWQFSKRYWPKSHMQVIQQVIKWMSKGVKVYYITGNHDEMLRKFSGFKIGSLKIDNKLVLELDGKKVWIFHGDVFDITMQHSKWLTKLGAHGYDLLILINTFCNWISVKIGKEKISLSKNIKNAVKSAVKFINDFERTCADIAISNHYDYVVCGHIHHPEIKRIQTEKGEVQYLNSGDWVENLTALEYDKGRWSLYHYKEEDFVHDQKEENESLEEMSNEELFNRMLNEFNSLPTTVKTELMEKAD
jgi:UDP-2,3-diacylglucosamine pyrophosphatase LpxH